MTKVKQDILRLLQEFLSSRIYTNTKEEIFNANAPALNLLHKNEITHLINQIKNSSTSDQIAINKIENLMQSVQYNHKKDTI